MTHSLTTTGLRAGAALALAAGLGAGLGLAGSAVAAGKPYEPHPKTIVDVDGSAAAGFAIHRYDGTVDHTVPRSQARATCRAMTTELDRVVCRQEIRLWHRDLYELQRSITYTQHVERAAVDR